MVVMPGLVDLHAHLREPGGEDAETIGTGLAAAAAGGFTTVCAMPNTMPPIDGAAAVRDVLARGRDSRSPVRLLTYGTITAGRAGERLAPMSEMAAAGAIGFSDDGAPIDDAALFQHALAYAGGVGRPLVEHPELRALTRGAEAHDGLAATILGLAGWPVAAEAAAVARALALLEEVARQAPSGAVPRLHLTHVSTADALALIRVAKAAGLPVTCDVTPHHLALHDGWLGGDRRFAWEAVAAPWAGEASAAEPFDPGDPGEPAPAVTGSRPGPVGGPRRRHSRCHRHRPCPSCRDGQARRVRRRRPGHRRTGNGPAPRAGRRGGRPGRPRDGRAGPHGRPSPGARPGRARRARARA